MQKSLTYILLGLLLSMAFFNRQYQQESKVKSTGIDSSLPPSIALTVVALGPIKGFISNLLWMEATDKQDEKEFFDTLQITKWISQIQPNNPDVWKYIAWNMSFNISNEFSELKEKWQWVDRGLQLLRKNAYGHSNKAKTLAREMASSLHSRIHYGGTKKVRDYYYQQYSEQRSKDQFSLKDTKYYQSIIEEFKLDKIGPSTSSEELYYILYPNDPKNWTMLFHQKKNHTASTLRSSAVSLLRFGQRIKLANGKWHSLEYSKPLQVVQELLKEKNQNSRRDNIELAYYISQLSGNKKLAQLLPKQDLSKLRNRHFIRMKKLEIKPQNHISFLLWESQICFQHELLDKARGRLNLLKKLYNTPKLAPLGSSPQAYKDFFKKFYLN